MNARLSAVASGIRMNGDEHVSVFAVGNVRPLRQRDLPVVAPRVNHIGIGHVLFNLLAQSQRHFQANVFLEQPVRTSWTKVRSTVARINHDRIGWG